MFYVYNFLEYAHMVKHILEMARVEINKNHRAELYEDENHIEILLSNVQKLPRYLYMFFKDFLKIIYLIIKI